MAETLTDQPCVLRPSNHQAANLLAMRPESLFLNRLFLLIALLCDNLCNPFKIIPRNIHIYDVFSCIEIVVWQLCNGLFEILPKHIKSE